MIAKAAAVIALITSIGGTYAWLDTSYVRISDYRDFQWSVMKEQLNNTRERIYNSRTPDEKAHWQRELRELLDLFCRKYPQDRECGG